MQPRTRFALPFLAFPFLALGGIARAQCQFLEPPDPAFLEAQGQVVVSDGTTLLMARWGMPLVHVFRRVTSQWTYEAALEPPTGEAWGDGGFGVSAAVHGDLAAVGASGMDGGEGRVVLYARTEDPVTGLGSWTWTQTLTSPNEINDFGTELACDGATLAVGAPGSDKNGSGSGAVVVYDVSSGSVQHVQEVFSPEHEAGAQFGAGLDVLGTRLLVGAPLKDGRGWVDVFVLNGGTWGWLDRFTAPGTGVASFGLRVDLVSSGVVPTAFVAAPETTVGGLSGAGRVYRFTEQPIVGGVRWYHTDTFDDPAPATNRQFGHAIAGSLPLFGTPRLVASEFGPEVHVFAQSGGAWSHTATETSPGGAPVFGFDLWADGAGFVAGSPYEDGQVTGQGGAFAFSFGLCPDPARLAAPGLAPGDALGAVVDVQGDVALVGLPGADVAGADAGSAWIYRRSGAGWERECVLLASDAAPGDALGSAVALGMGGNLALVGAPLRDNGFADAGVAYLYTHDGTDWVELGSFFSLAPREAGRFGSAVALDGAWAAVGEPGDGTLSGRAWTYVRDAGGSWSPGPGLQPDDPLVPDAFGASLALRGGTLVVGDPGDGAGAAYVHDLDAGAWPRVDKLVGASAGEGFGGALGLAGPFLTVGAPEATVQGEGRAGRACLFRRDAAGAFALERVLTEEAPVADACFGGAVAADGAFLALGAGEAAGPGSGRVVVLERLFSGHLRPSARAPVGASAGAGFGGAVVLSGRDLVVGAPGDDSEAADGGSAWAYRLAPSSPRRARFSPR